MSDDIWNKALDKIYGVGGPNVDDDTTKHEAEYYLSRAEVALKAKDKRIAELEADRAELIDEWVEFVTEKDQIIERLRAALWTEYQEDFNDLGPTRQARWESADAYANALMADFDREALRGDEK